MVTLANVGYSSMGMDGIMVAVFIFYIHSVVNTYTVFSAL